MGAKIILLAGIVSLLLAEPRYLPLSPGENPVYRHLRSLGEQLAPSMEERAVLKEIFIPLGWGDERRFAYLTLPPNEARDCPWATLTIQDLSTDRTLLRKEYTLCPDPGEKDPDDPLSLLRRVDRKYQGAIDSLLFRHEIHTADRLTLRPFPIDSRQGPIRYRLSTCRRNEPDLVPDELFISRWRLELERTLHRSVFRSKTLHTQKYTDYSGLYELGILGYYLSPKGTRAALLIGKLQRGWEGPPSTLEYQVIGASLEKGWKTGSR